MNSYKTQHYKTLQKQTAVIRIILTASQGYNTTYSRKSTKLGIKLEQSVFHKLSPTLRPLTHAPEIGAIGTRRQSMTLEVVHYAARKTGAGIWRRIKAYGTDFWSRFLERVSGA